MPSHGYRFKWAIFDEACHVHIPDDLFKKGATMGEDAQAAPDGQPDETQTGTPGEVNAPGEGVSGTPVIPDTPAPDVRTDDQQDKTAAAEEAADPGLTGGDES